MQMNCEECEKVQESGHPICATRLGPVHVVLIGCADHVLSLAMAFGLASGLENMDFEAVIASPEDLE